MDVRAGGVIAAVALALAAVATPASAFDPAAESANAAKSQERFAGAAGDAGFQQQLALQSLSGTTSLAQLLAQDPARLPVNPCATGAAACAGDARVYDWGGRYGLVRPVQYVNRNGATISAHLWAPLPKPGRTQRRLPAILIVSGDIAPEEVYWWAAAALARSGYVVMTFDPQGHGHSDTLGTGTDLNRHVAIQQSSGAGSNEGDADADASEQTNDALDFLLSSPALRYMPVRSDGAPTSAADPSPGQAKQRDRAARGLADAYDPLRGLIGGGAVGLAGHSRGADAASIVGSRDPRVGAIVAWDNLIAGSAPNAGDGGLPVAPRVPALGMSADYYETSTPYTDDPDPQGKNEAFAAYRAAGIDAMELTVRGGTHYEFSYVPNPGFPATLRGIDMASWYTTAWFDKYLKHEPSADARLLTDRWRADQPGAAVDSAGSGNLFSFYYRSRLDIHVTRSSAAALGRRHTRQVVKRHRRVLHRRARHRGHRRKRHRRRPAAAAPLSVRVTCDDLRAGCPALIPRALDGYAGEYSYLSAAQR